jgi:hypothetical protein
MLADVCLTEPPRQAASGRAPRELSPATAALDDVSCLGIRRVSCLLQDGVATLEGRLPTFHLKQLAQERARRVEGVVRVDNRILVDAFDDGPCEEWIRGAFGGGSDERQFRNRSASPSRGYRGG